MSYQGQGLFLFTISTYISFNYVPGTALGTGSLLGQVPTPDALTVVLKLQDQSASAEEQKHRSLSSMEGGEVKDSLLDEVVSGPDCEGCKSQLD